MFTVTRKVGLDAGHRVPFHNSKCRHLHGHRYTIEAVAAAPKTIDYKTGSSSAGMLVDFGDLKRAMMERVHDVYDHRLILWHKDPLLEGQQGQKFAQLVEQQALGTIIRVPCIPTAEELARLWFGHIDEALRTAKTASGLRLTGLKVWETPNNVATFRPEFS